MVEKEDTYVNDAIITEKLRTKYKPIIPPYDAQHDKHAKLYFNKTDVRDLMSVTCPYELVRNDNSIKIPILVTVSAHR